MKRALIRLIGLCMALCLMWSAAYAQPADVQIRVPGAQASAEGVTISKTIQPAGAENLFDITLQVQTTQSLDKLRQADDAAVVLVTDISATMNQKLEGSSGPSRLDAAKTAASAFVEAFCDGDRLLGSERELGFVTFNISAQTLFALEEASAEKKGQWLNAISGMTAPTSQSGLGWTNIESGLVLAQNLLNASNAKHKFIILLTDGLPTTYVSQNADVSSHEKIDGLDPTSGFWDRVKNVECTMGTSYSETGAQRARAAAKTIKESGVDVFSIGVGLGSPIQVNGQWVPETIQAHLDRITWNASVVERPAAAAAPGYRYEIGDADDPDSYRYWLGGSTENGGIGGGEHFGPDSPLHGTYGAYVDANDEEALEQAFSHLLGEIESINISAIRDTWITSDPMGDSVAFLSFLDPGTNAAFFEDHTIVWDLKASPFMQSTAGNTTTWTYSLRYRIRLKNEEPGFLPATTANVADEPSHLTNGHAELHYKVETNGQLSAEKQLSFAMPAVEGYLGTLAFGKHTSETGGPHAGMTFQLDHRSDCPVCQGSVVIPPLTGTSDVNGRVVISRIPSGHAYRLTETNAAGYVQREHLVNVDYGSVSLTDTDGCPVDTILNELIPGTITLSARKSMDGNAPSAGAFSFVLMDSQGAAIETQTNAADGSITFSPLSFSVPGTYVFTLREIAGGSAFIAYDPAVYTVTVEARKTENGCAASIAGIQKNGAAHAGEILFENRTHIPTPPPTHVPKTGDDSQPLIWLALLILSAGGAALAWRRRHG